MNNIYFTPFEKSKIEFTKFIQKLFSENPSINLLAFFIRNSHIVRKGVIVEENNNLEILSIDINGNNIMKTLKYNMFDHSSFPLLPLFFSHTLLKQKHHKDNSIQFPHIKSLLKDIRSQDIFKYSNQLELEQKGPWIFHRNSIAGDRDDFFGNELNIKLQADHLYFSLNQSTPFNHFIHKHKI